jgi:hypothetical protein
MAKALNGPKHDLTPLFLTVHPDAKLKPDNGHSNSKRGIDEAYPNAARLGVIPGRYCARPISLTGDRSVQPRLLATYRYRSRQDLADHQCQGPQIFGRNH